MGSRVGWSMVTCGGSDRADEHKNLPYRLLFPYAGVRQALAGSETFFGFMQQLRAEFGEVFAHFGDSDVVSLVNPDGDGRSVFDRYSDAIRSSRVGGESSPLVWLGGAVGYRAAPVDGGRDAAAGQGPDVAAKLTVLLSFVHKLLAGAVGYFSEQNVVLNTGYLGPVQTGDGRVVDGLLASMSQPTAQRLQRLTWVTGCIIGWASWGWTRRGIRSSWPTRRRGC